MHRLWDSDMIEWFTRSEDAWLKDLILLESPKSQEKVSEGTAEDWATESLWTARTAFQDPTTDSRIKSGTKLGRQYYDANLPVLRQRMVQAAMRLAMVLNEAFLQR